MKFKVLVTNRIPDAILAPLADIAEIIHGPEGGDLMPRTEVLEHLPEVDAVINQAELKVDLEILDAGKKLKIIANVSLGYDNLDLPLMTSRHVWAANVGDVFTEATADATLALLLSVARKVGEGDRYIRAGRWKGFQPGLWDGLLLSGKTFGIVGYGRIGEAVERRALAFGMNVIHTRRQPTGKKGFRELEALLSESDVVSLHLPLTPQTHQLLNAKTLAQMKPGAILINMARGKVVEESALVDGLLSGRLGGAGLDVFENEPAVHPALLKLVNVVMTPHLGGGTRESRAAARSMAVENVRRVLLGETPVTPLNSPSL